ncbi:MAG: class I mannose-6-phosphate isomerase [Bacteriovoracaceae bacterium]|nr:class I mannose-6-phosphate isomerase [Bacteriovoracaceae bacterium]
MEDLEILRPSFVTKVWGGTKLAKLKSISDETILPLGESWEISRHADGPSKLENGQSLDQLLEEVDLPYLVKFIDTTDNLSIQVHPGDEYAKRVEKSSGKTECWLILESGPNTGIYLGLKEGVTKERLEEALLQKEDISLLLQFHPVSRGDFFFVPAGAIHAIGRGVTLAEIQQSSGITYRVWDWNRQGIDGKPRELHISKALDVINFEATFNNLKTFKIKKGIFNQEQQRLVTHSDFNVDLYCQKSGETIRLDEVNERRLRSLVCLEGELECRSKGILSYESALLTSSGSYKVFCKGEGSSQNSIFIFIS